MEGGGAAAVRALNARPRLPLPRVALAAVDAPLQESQAEESVTTVVRAPLVAL